MDTRHKGQPQYINWPAGWLVIDWLITWCDILSVGSLVMRHPGEMSTPTQGSILFGTVNGAIGKSADVI